MRQVSRLQRLWLGTTRALLLGGYALAFASSQACGSGDPRPDLSATSTGNNTTRLCEDADGDGFGLGCARGLDCDDTDAAVGVGCFCEDEPSPGCACDEEGKIAGCGRAYARAGQQLVCGEGVTTCSQGVWGECIINSAVSLRPQLKSLALGGASECTSNPCSPTCTTFNDTPGDIGVSEDDGLVEDEDGITLAGDPGTGGPPIGGGFGCEGGAYPATTGACAHHVCEVGDVLDPTCDEKPAGTATVTLFSDSFDSGNSQGWSMDSSWEIGEAQSSSDQTTADADPANDATSTSDDNVAGTVLGGSIGGGTVIFSDTFSNLNKWTETGDGGWNTEGLQSSWGYSGTGTPAAHADNCDNGCTITLKSAIDLSGYSSASLDLLRYVDTGLDYGEYLRLDAYNGSSWSTLFNWYSEDYDDGYWHSESFDLSSYLVSGFKIRLVTKESKDTEHVQVDDVHITVPATNETRWLTSPAFDATSANGDVTLEFKRWLNIEDPASRTAMVEVYDGSSWVNLWTSSAALTEDAWSTRTLDLTDYKNSAMKIRFGWSGAATSKVSGWNLDDVVVTGDLTTPAGPGCVAAVCAVDSTCCLTSWHAGCLALIEDECQISCSIDTSNDECVACYNDPTETTDYDGDGASPAEGDCMECDPSVNPGAFDFKGNGVDDDCDGTADNGLVACDGSLSASGDAWDHAKAMGLCRVADDNSWGVLEASFVRADGVTPCTDSNQYRIVNDFGSGNLPTEGSQMAVYSSGTARDASDSGWVQPNGDGYDAGTTSTPAHSVPAASGCSVGTPGRDSCGLKLKLRAPTNAQSFSFNFDFFTSEYPEWLCTYYNDAFVAYYDGSLNTTSDTNISFDSQGNPVSVNNGFFEVPGWPPPSGGSDPLLNGSGFDGVCNNNYIGSTYKWNSICGGATGWLQTSAPVAPGEEITLHFSIWDTEDHQWDSTVLLDNFAWSASEASIETGRYEPGEDTAEPLMASSFTRDYDASDICADDQVPVWTLWSWSTSTPSDSRVEFYVSTADSAAELDTAPEDPLVFSDPPGPSSLAGDNAVAQAGSPDTQTGTAIVHDTLVANGRDPAKNFVRIRSYLVPSSDGLSAPVLQNWNLQLGCAEAE